MGRHYGSLNSPEEMIYATLLAELQESPELKPLSAYIYEFADDEDTQEEVPGEERLPAIRLEIVSNPSTPSSNVFEDCRMGVAIIAFVPGHHRGDAFGWHQLLRRTFSRKKFRHHLASLTAEHAAYVVGFQQGPIARYGSPRMQRCESLMTIEYRVPTFKE